MNRTALRLDEAIAAVCPIVGVAIKNGAVDRIDFAPAATDQQKAAAQSVAASFDFSAAAQAAWEASKLPAEKTGLVQAAQQAIDDNATYLALGTPTPAQVAAQVKRLTQQNTAIIKRLMQV